MGQCYGRGSTKFNRKSIVLSCFNDLLKGLSSDAKLPANNFFLCSS